MLPLLTAYNFNSQKKNIEIAVNELAFSIDPSTVLSEK